MPTLRDVQRAMLASIIDRADDAIATMIVAGGIPPANRLRIYRNNSMSALVESMRLSYPAIEKLVGEEFFEVSARRFVQENPPRTAWLYDYGGEFADFLATFPPAVQLAYLPEVARLEWAINGALHAVDCVGLDMAALAALADADPSRLHFTPHPAVRLLRFDFPADVIWRAVLRGDDEELGKLDLAEGTSWLLVERGSDGVQVTRIKEAEWRFASTLFAGASLEVALEFAQGIDAPSVLAQHFVSGRIAAFTLASPDRATRALEASS